jgi:hypothetical protein
LEQKGCQQQWEPSNSRNANNSMNAKKEGTSAKVGTPTMEGTTTKVWKHKEQKGCQQQLATTMETPTTA